MSLEPLEFGIDSSQRDKLIKLINKYIDLSFSNKKLRELYFVIQPTIKHVNNEYIMDNRDILFSAINNHEFKNNIHVIDFFDFDENFYEFVDGDIFLIQLMHII